jgi:hypothetical protein
MEKCRARHVNGTENFLASMMAGFPRKEVLFGRNGALINWIEESVAGASMREQEADAEEFHIGCATSCLIF